MYYSNYSAMAPLRFGAHTKHSSVDEKEMQHLHRLPGYRHNVVVLATACHALYLPQPLDPQQACRICTMHCPMCQPLQ